NGDLNTFMEYTTENVSGFNRETFQIYDFTDIGRTGQKSLYRIVENPNGDRVEIIKMNYGAPAESSVLDDFTAGQTLAVSGEVYRVVKETDVDPPRVNAEEFLFSFESVTFHDFDGDASGDIDESEFDTAKLKGYIPAGTTFGAVAGGDSLISEAEYDAAIAAGQIHGPVRSRPKYTGSEEWVVELNGAVYDLALDEFNGGLILNEYIRASEAIQVFEFDSAPYTMPDLYREGGNDIQYRRVQEVTDEFRKRIENQPDPKGPAVWPTDYNIYTEQRKKYRITREEGGAERLGLVVTESGGLYGIDTDYVCTTRMSEEYYDELGDIQYIDTYFDVFKDSDDNLYIAYDAIDPTDTWTQSSGGADPMEWPIDYTTVIVKEDTDHVNLNGSRYKIAITRELGTNEIEAVAFDKVTETGRSMKGIQVGSDIIQVGERQGTYHVCVGENQWLDGQIFSRINESVFGKSYYPERFESNPYTGAVTFGDGLTYEMVRDLDDPSSVRLIQDNVTSYKAPDVSLGDDYYTVRQNTSGRFVMQEAHKPYGKSFEAELLTIDYFDGDLDEKWDLGEFETAEDRGYVAEGTTFDAIDTVVDDLIDDAEFAAAVSAGLIMAQYVDLPAGRFVVRTDAGQFASLIKEQPIVSEDMDRTRVFEVEGQYYYISDKFAGNHLITNIFDEFDQTETYFDDDPVTGQSDQELAVIMPTTDDIYKYRVITGPGPGDVRLEEIYEELHIEPNAEGDREVIFKNTYFRIEFETGTGGRVIRFRHDDRAGFPVYESDPAQPVGNIYTSEINIKGTSYEITENMATGEITVKNFSKPTIEAYAIKIKGKDKPYVVRDAAPDKDGKDAVSYLITTEVLVGGVLEKVTYKTDPATDTIRLDDGVVYDVIVRADGKISLKEKDTETSRVEKMRIEGKFYTLSRNANDVMHKYSLDDGYGLYNSAKDTYGFYEDEANLYSRVYGTADGEGKENFEGFDNLFQASDGAPKFQHNEINYRVDVADTGLYDIGLFARTFEGMDEPEAGGYKMGYQFSIWVDGILEGHFKIWSDKDEHQVGSLPVYIRDGLHDIKIAWEIELPGAMPTPPDDLTVEVKDVFLQKHAQRLADLDNDLVVTTDDYNALVAQQIPSLTAETEGSFGIGEDVPAGAGLELEQVFTLKGIMYYAYYDDSDASSALHKWAISDGSDPMSPLEEDLATGEIMDIYNNIYDITDRGMGADFTMEEKAEGDPHGDQIIECDGRHYIVT
ncbi:hypothetical protein ACFL3N_03275, partial [Candidatus Omnitrophota bacterium]